ncbi:hypothetical protein RUND412_002115 [Rhizina undulata]
MRESISRLVSKLSETEIPSSPIRPSSPPICKGNLPPSPLKNAEVYLEKSLCKFPKLWEWLGGHDVGSIQPFEAEAFMPTTSTDLNGGKKRIVLVEGRKGERMKKVVKSLVEIRNRRREIRMEMGEEHGVERDVWEIYDWRICRHFSDERDGGVDWELWRARTL